MFEESLYDLSTTSHPLPESSPPAQTPNGCPSIPSQAHFSGATHPGQSSAPAYAPTFGSLSTATTLASASGASSSANDACLDPVFLELCVNAGQYLKCLGEVDLSSIRTDGDFFSVVKENYIRLRSFRARFWLLKPSTVSYVRVSICYTNPLLRTLILRSSPWKIAVE